MDHIICLFGSYTWKSLAPDTFSVINHLYQNSLFVTILLFSVMFILVCEHEWFPPRGFTPSLTVHIERGATSANVFLSLFFKSVLCRFSSQSCLISPHEVLTLPSGKAVLHRVVPVARSAVWAEGEAETGCAVADLEEAIGAEEGVSFASTQVVDCLQVVINCSVS